VILVDTSIWIDHLHRTEPALVDALTRAAVLQHPMVIGELSLGTLRDRSTMLAMIANLPAAPVASHGEVARFVEAQELYGQGLSLVDVHLLASVTLAPGATLWTRDKRLKRVAERLGRAHGN
jgi:predicted nucleic acid-binding protein